MMLVRKHRALRGRALCLGLALAGLGSALAGCDGGKGNGGTTRAGNVLYTESNNTASGQNAVLAYRRAANGTLTLLNTYQTGGMGTSEPTLTPSGVLDTDKNVIVNAQHTLLFAVNQGSDTIAVFHIQSDGTLTPVTGSPFPSGGHAPVSLGLTHNDTVLTVVNSSLDPARNTSDIAPNYTNLSVNSSTGALTSIANATVSIPVGSTPSIALPSPDGSLIFDANFLAAKLRVLQVGANGSLTQASSSPVTPDPAIFTGDAAGKPMVNLGVGVYPITSQRLVYVNYPLAQRLAVYSYDSVGNLTFVRAVPNSGKIACWIVINSTGTRLYTTNAGSGDVSVFDIGTDPTTPKQLQLLNVSGITGSANVNGNPWQMTLDSNGQFLYVLTPRDLQSTPAGQGNTVHTLQVNSDGTLTEVPNSVIALPVPVGTSPQGIVAL